MYGAFKLYKQLQFIRLGGEWLCSLLQTTSILKRVSKSPTEIQNHTWGKGELNIKNVHVQKWMNLSRTHWEFVHKTSPYSSALQYYFPQERQEQVAKAKTGVICTLIWHFDPEVHKKGRHILCFSHARADLVIGNIFTHLAMQSYKHWLLCNGILPAADILLYRCAKSLQDDSLLLHSCHMGKTVDMSPTTRKYISLQHSAGKY